MKKNIKCSSNGWTVAIRCEGHRSVRYGEDGLYSWAGDQYDHIPEVSLMTSLLRGEVLNHIEASMIREAMLNKEVEVWIPHEMRWEECDFPNRIEEDPFYLNHKWRIKTLT